MSDAPIEVRFRAALGSIGERASAGLLVAVSGGLDSVVLLHLLRFGLTERPDMVAAHFDHAMRPGSGDDARWVAGLCTAWGVPARVGRADTVPRSEAEAREARYAFLEDARQETAPRLVLTAHHADDQAETVLFRAVRGTGQAGLAGISPVRHGIARPLLAFWREELEEYAGRARLSWRDDPTNRSPAFARNALRLRVLPDIERLVAPGARRALVRLSDLAREEEAGWESVLPILLAPLGVEERDGRLSLDRSGLAALHPAVRARVLRALAARVGCTPDEGGTRRAVEFAAVAASGRTLELGGSVTLARELDRLTLGPRSAALADRPLEIPDEGPGTGSALISGREVPVWWGGAVAEARPDPEPDPTRGSRGRPAPRSGAPRATFDPEALRFPLCVRAREPGDRIRFAGGSKKVKKLLLELRVPPSQRSSVPLVVDAAGDVLWIPGVARAASPVAAGALSIAVG